MFYVFDILWCKGFELMQLPLAERKEILSKAIPFNEVIRYSDSFEQGIALFELIKKQEMEGIVAKRKTSQYQPGNRGKDWLKLPAEKRQEFVVGGWAESSSGRAFRSLLFGAYNKNKQLEWIGRSGGG
ncbi:MAG: ATP-dependent DNA ligase [Ginsengibacter sp.]